MTDKALTPDVRRSASPAERVKPSAEDPDTATTRKEFDNTRISEPNVAAAMATSQQPTSKPSGDAEKTTPELPVPDTQNDALKEQLSSPKKKRAHDEVESNKDSAQDPNGDVSPIGANGAASSSRSDRLEPEKKRHRDTPSEVKAGETQDAKTTASGSTSDETKAPVADKPATSESAFKSSGLSGFAAASASPFMAAGAKPLTSFASASASPSPFGASASSKSNTPSLFGSGSAANGSSPFGQIGGASKPFGGSAFGGGFSSSFGSSKLTSFGQPGSSLKSGKPAKAFGAPDSDLESDGEGEADDTTSTQGDNDKQDKDEGDNDTKKTKLQRVAVDNGEAGEATVLQMRAKIFQLDKGATAWRERGAGNLKINVPIQCIDTDENGQAIPGSFDASSLEDGDVKTVRLIMRQDSTHRLILNTTLIPAMTFQEKPMNKTVCVLFTAIEGPGEAVSVQLKMNPANAKSFLNEVGKIQRELQSN